MPLTRPASEFHTNLILHATLNRSASTAARLAVWATRGGAIRCAVRQGTLHGLQRSNRRFAESESGCQLAAPETVFGERSRSVSSAAEAFAACRARKVRLASNRKRK